MNAYDGVNCQKSSRWWQDISAKT